MDTFRVGTEDVQMMAFRWRAQAATLGVSAPPPMGLSCQPSAAAVNAAHTAIATAAASLTARVRASAPKVAAADTGYLANEASSAAQLAAVADPERGR
jgi:hypothetical protein